MSRALWVDPEQLRARAAAFQEIGDEVRQVVTQLQAALSAEGRWWGDDESGAAFGQHYEPDANKAITALRDIAAALHGFGAQVSEAADTVVAVDQAAGGQVENAVAAADLGPRLPGDGSVPRLWRESPVIGTPALAAPKSAASPGTSEPVDTPVSGTSPGSTDTGDRTPEVDRDRFDRAGDGLDSAGDGLDSAREGLPPEAPTVPDEGPRTGSPVTGRNEQRLPDRGPTPKESVRAVREPHVGRDGSSAGLGRRNTADLGGPRRGDARPPAVSAVGDRKPPSTPWVGNADPSGSAPGRPSPAAAPGNRDGGKPTKDDKPASGRRPTDGGRRPGAADPTAGPRAESTLTRVARGLAERHGVAVAGFDNRDLDEAVVGEFLEAIDDVLTRYPVITVRGVEIGSVAGDRVVCVDPREPDPDAERAAPEWGVTIDGEQAANPARLVEILRKKRRPGATVPGAETRVVYEATVREFGRAFDRAGDRSARGRAQRTLIAEYLSGDTEYRGTSLARVVAGYRRWRDQLRGCSFDKGVFDPGAALEDAFTDVMLNGDKAAEPAKTLCRLLTDTAEAATRMGHTRESGHG